MLSKSNESQALVPNAGTGIVASRSPLFPRLHDCLRQFRLQILAVCLYPFSSWKTKDENRKVAIYSSRCMAILHGLIHIVPFTGALTLLVLFWMKYFIGPAFGGTTALQFVAKLHELLMQVSIANISLSVVRALAIKHYVPLGVLSGAAHTKALSYLWSLDFWATVRARGFHGWHKILFLCSFPLLLLLTALVGPSAAVLMIPRPDQRYVNATETLFATDYIFPSTTISDVGFNGSMIKKQPELELQVYQIRLH